MYVGVQLLGAKCLSNLSLGLKIMDGQLTELQSSDLNKKTTSSFSHSKMQLHFF